MKKANTFAFLTGLAMLISGCGEGGGISIWSILLLVLALPVLAFGGLRIYSIVEYNRHRNRGGRRRRARKIDPMTWGILGLGVVLIVAALLLPGTSGQEMPAPVETEPPQTQQPTEETEEPIYTMSRDFY